MALFRYLRRKDNLPDPNGSLSLSIPSRNISAINREVYRDQDSGKKRRGPYGKYSPEERFEIGRHASLHGITAASRHFSLRFKRRVGISTVQSIRKDYVNNLRRKRTNPDENDVAVLPLKKRGRPVLLGRELDDKVQAYLMKIREAGGAVSARIAMATARGVLLTYDKTRLEEFGGSIRLNRYWAHSLLKRMNFVQRKATTAKSKQSEADFSMLKKSFLADVFTTVTMEDVPPELILNWDQTGIKLVPSSSWTMALRGSGRVEMTGVTDKRQITAVFCGSLVGDFLPVQLIYKGKTQRCHPLYDFPPGWSITP